MNLHRACCCDETLPPPDCGHCGPGNSMVRAFRVDLSGYLRCTLCAGNFPQMNGSYYCIPVLPFTGDSCKYEDGPVGTVLFQGQNWNVFFVFSVANGGTIRMGHEIRHPSGSPSQSLTSFPSGGSLFIPAICQEVTDGHQLSLWPVNNTGWFAATGCSVCGSGGLIHHYDARGASATVFAEVD